MKTPLGPAMYGPEGCLGQALADGDPVVLRVDGGCMEPQLADRAAVRIRRVRWYLPGDPVAFYSPCRERLLMHRFLGYLWWRGGWKVMTMADRGARPDALVGAEHLLGKVIEHDGRPYRVALRWRFKSILRYAFWLLWFPARRVLRFLR